MSGNAFWSAYNNAFRAGEARNDAFFQGREQQTQRTAAKALAGGDYDAATRAYAGAGMADQVLAVQDRRRQSEEQGRKLNAERLTVLAQAAQALRTVPTEQRAAAYQAQVAPTLKRLGMPDDMLAQIGTADMSDQSLDLFVQTLGQRQQAQMQFFEGPDGIYAADKATGQVGRKVGFTPKAPEPKYMKALDEDGNEVIVAVGAGQPNVVYTGGKPQLRAPAGYRISDDGETLEAIPGGPADPASKPQNLRPLPSPVIGGYQENKRALSKVQEAIAAVRTYPKAFGLVRGVGDMVNQRVDPDGVPVRALVADIGSLKIHDRSGAAVAAAEFPRLKPFVPTVTDTPETVLAKLENFEREYQAVIEDMEASYDERAGYMPLARPAAPSQPAPAQPGRVRRYNPATGRIE